MGNRIEATSHGSKKWMRSWLGSCSVGVLGLLVADGSVFGQTNNSYPMLMSLKPVAAQIGNSTVHELNARYNLAGATQVLVSGEGVVGEIVTDETSKPEDANRNDITSSKCKLKFTVVADAMPGVRDFRILTPHGVSTVGQLVIARDPVVSESPENDTADKAQVVSIPSTLCGAIEKGEDVDYFKFQLGAGQSVVFHVRSQRLLNRLHDMQTRIDPLIAIRNEQGSILGSSDNHFAGDPLLHFQADKAGDYYLEVRDVRYQGNVDWIYSIEAHSRPFVTHMFPSAIQRGVKNTVQLIGFNLPANAAADIQLPMETQSSIPWPALPQLVVPTYDGVPLQELLVWNSDLPVVVESPLPIVSAVAGGGTSPSENVPKTLDLASLPKVTVPGVIAGRVDLEGEVDRYVFEAKAQEKLSLQVFARRSESHLDPVMRILNSQGAPLVEIDDGTFDRVQHADCLLENWVVPADGQYVLEIRDLHQRGGVRFPYGVSISRAEPYFQLEIDTDKTLLAPGMGSAFFVKALRKNGFVGEIQLGVDRLPAGVTAVAGRILADGNDGCIVLKTSADASQAVGNIDVFGIGAMQLPDGTGREWKTQAKPMQEYYSPGGGRGNYPVDFHTVSIANPMDVRAVKLSQSVVEIKPGGSQRIEIEIERAPDYKGNVTLDVIMQHLEQPYGSSLPRGVKIDVAASKTLLTGEDKVGYITLVAAPDAPAVDRQVVPVLAHVSINFVMKHTFCSDPLLVSVLR